MTITEMVERSYKTAEEKGWHDKPRTFGDILANIHAELSEAWEDHRNGRGPGEKYYEGDKPCGIGVELADVLIRIGDYCGEHKIDLEELVFQKMGYNKTRPYRHGGKSV